MATAAEVSSHSMRSSLLGVSVNDNMSEWWDEDSELLGATLGLLVAWEGDARDPSHSCSAPTPTTDSNGSIPRTNMHPGSVRKSRINTSRERRKQELQFLRKTTHDLEIQLSDLRDRRDALLRPHYCDDSRRQLATVAPVWERMAIRQFQSRKRSESINARLRTMLSAQRRVAQDFCRAIQVAETRSREIGPMKPQSLRTPVDVSQVMSEEEQLTRLDSMCENWEPEIRRCTKASNDARDPLQFSNLQVVNTSEEEAVVEMLMSSVLPYSVTRVEEAMWSLHTDSVNMDTEDESSSQHTKVTDNLAIGVYSGTKIGVARANFHRKFVTKRFHPTATQALIVTHMQSAPDGSPNQLDGVTPVQVSWIRLIDAKELGHSLMGTLTVVQHVQRERIVRNKSGDSVDMEAVTQTVMAQIREDMEFVQQHVEDMLTSGWDGDHVKSEMQ